MAVKKRWQFETQTENEDSNLGIHEEAGDTETVSS